MEHKTLLENMGLIKSDLVEAVTILFYEDKRIESSSFGIGGGGNIAIFTTCYDYYPLCKAVINNKYWEIKGQLSKNNLITEEDKKYSVGVT